MSSDHPLRPEFEAYILRDRGAEYLRRNDPAMNSEHDYAETHVQKAWEAWQSARKSVSTISSERDHWERQAKRWHDLANVYLSWYADSRQLVSFQSRVHHWMIACFGEQITSDAQERNHRLVEEALELAQSCGCTRSEAMQLVDYVFDRPVGEKLQEVGGVMVTLAALCTAQGINMLGAGETELARVWTKIEMIHAKQAAKPKHSPLPVPTFDGFPR
jgi:hypothetical protein